ncbi:hypothetical protein DFP91_4592 [Pseudorhodoplanes sinuspersici]|nr:hypothetical protein DFP91_4592 [Pseudorhodoplanes sinuspersici]
MRFQSPEAWHSPPHPDVSPDPEARATHGVAVRRLGRRRRPGLTCQRQVTLQTSCGGPDRPLESFKRFHTKIRIAECSTHHCDHGTNQPITRLMTVSRQRTLNATPKDEVPRSVTWIDFTSFPPALAALYLHLRAIPHQSERLSLLEWIFWRSVMGEQTPPVEHCSFRQQTSRIGAMEWALYLSRRSSSSRPYTFAFPLCRILVRNHSL